jgi:hypothetical protein
MALFIAGGEALDRMILIKAFPDAVNPSKTERPFNGIVIQDGRLTGVFLGKISQISSASSKLFLTTPASHRGYQNRSFYQFP